MKRMSLLLLGIFSVMLFAAVSVSAGSSADRASEYAISPIGQGGGTYPQSPVLDGGAYTNYDTIFVHGVNAEVHFPNSDLEEAVYNKDGLLLHLFPKVSGIRKSEINCPVPSYQLKTGGVQPRVRYIAVEYFSDIMVSGHSWPEVYKVEVYNGHVLVRTISNTFSSPIYSVQIIDLGNWYAFDRGLNIVLSIRSDITDYSGFYLSGYAARFEW